MNSKREHDPEKACPALDAGWVPVFGKDHAPASEYSSSFGLSASAGRCSALAGAAEEVTGPAGVVGRARHLGHQLFGSDILQVRRCGAVAQRLQGVVDALYGGLERLVALQRHAHALAGEIRAVAERPATAEDDGDAQFRGRGLELLLGPDADEEHGID